MERGSSGEDVDGRGVSIYMARLDEGNDNALWKRLEYGMDGL